MTAPPQISFLCPVIVGRETERSRLRAFLAQDRGVLLISGEAGVGKSGLVREASQAAEATGPRVLESRCFEADRALPLAPAIDILRAQIDRHGAAEIARLAGSAVGDLARLAPELASHAVTPSGDGIDAETAKRRLFDGFVRLVCELAAGQSLLLIVEDIHWCDESSLDLLMYLARRTSRESLLLLLTYRGDEVKPALAHLLAALDRERLATEIALAPLDAHHVAAMLQAIFASDQAVPAGLLHTSFTLTEGNPFFLEEVLTALGAGGSLTTGDGRWVGSNLGAAHIPRSVHDAVRRRLDSLSGEARGIITLAAVAGRQFDFDLLRELTGDEERDLLAAMNELVAAQLVIEEPGDRFAFRHALTREAISAGLLDRERRTVHRKIATAIARHSDNSMESRVDDLAIHYFEARSWVEALPCARRAGERAATLHAPRAAAEQFTRAIAAARALALPLDPEIYGERGRAYETLGEFDRARDDYESALALSHASGDRRGEWQSLLDLSLLWASRDYGQAGSFAAAALDAARELDDPVAVARSLNRLGNWHVNVEEPKEATRLHHEALMIFESIGDERGIAETLDLLGMVGLMGEDMVAGTAAHKRAEPLWRSLGDRRGLASALLGLSLQAPTFHTDTLPALRSVREVREIGMQSIAVCREIDWRAGECIALWGFLGMTLGAAGEYDAALPGTRLALQIARETEHRQWITAARCILGNLYADLGDRASAQGELEAALELARQIGSLFWVRGAAGWLSSALVQAGDLDTAAAVLHHELGGDFPMDTIASRLLWCAAAELALAQGQPARTLDIIDRMVNAPLGDKARPVARLENLRGEALMAAGQHKEAESAFAAAREDAIWSGARPLLWRIEVARGRFYQTQRQPEAADRAFASARSIVEELAAHVPDDALRESLRDAARRVLPPAPSPSGPAFTPKPDGKPRSTKRELQVASLLTEGLTNREVGARLFLSEWTVATRVRNILAKLDVSSRAQIAAWAASHGLTPET